MGVVEVEKYDVAMPMEIECSTVEKDELKLEARVYAVGY